MTLKELKKMVAEEYAAYKRTIREQGAAGDIPGLPDPTVALSGDDVDTEGGNAEDILKDIYDKLKDHFEGGDEDTDDVDDVEDADDAGDDVEGEEDKEADLEEKASTGYGDSGAKKSSGTNGAYTKKVSVKENFKRNHKRALRKKILAESKMKSRFKTLANIKK